MRQLVALYNKEPTIDVKGWDNHAWSGYAQIAKKLKEKTTGKTKSVLVIECYPAVRDTEILEGLLATISPVKIVRSENAALDKEVLDQKLNRYLTDDRVFGFIAPFKLEELLDQRKVEKLKSEIEHIREGLVVVIGFGASLLAEGDVLVYADLSRWEIQLRFRSQEFGNWQANNHNEDILRKYKRGFFFEWRVADRLKRDILERIDFYLDTHLKDDPRMVSGQALLDGLKQTVNRPFRLVPYFDPGVWGGHWLEEHINLSPASNPYAWGFDGVPEENSLYFRFGQVRVELPSINLVFYQPKELLGEKVYAQFGAEFPIRFDFLDTIGGQNLSLQVHPTTDYIQQTFGMHYTQDESYYILDAEPEAHVYLGLKEDAIPELVQQDLCRAQNGELTFTADKYINTFQAKKHDHFLIPAGTIHCSARGCMVLEISATPYIFTFKLWDWDRVGLDGKPRPVHLEHGFKNIQWDRRTKWVTQQLVSQTKEIDRGNGWTEERTGLHEYEFIETRRHWFSKPVLHSTYGSVNVLNLIEGAEAVVESPNAQFDPFVVHYAETFIIPASVQMYTIRPSGPSEGTEIATIKAFVR